MKTRHRLLGMEAALLIGLLLAPDVGAQSAKKKIIVLGRGEKSAVIAGVAKTRQRLNHKEMVSAAKQRKEKLKSAKEERAETKKRIKAQLTDVDAVAADLSETTDGDEDDGLVVESAIEAGVPVVLENVNSAKMAKLAGIGVNAKTAVIETREGGGHFNITILDGPELKVKSGPAKVVKPPARKDADNKAHKRALEDYEVQQKADKAKAPKPANSPANTKLTGEQKAAHAERIITEKAFKKGAKRHAFLTEECAKREKCIEGSVVRLDLAYFCPQDPTSTACSTSNTLVPVIEYGVYKTPPAYDGTTGQPRPTVKVVTRAAGRPNLSMVSDATQDRGYYLDSWNIEFKADYPPNMGWILDRAAPENANKQATVAYTTGFTVGGGSTLSGTPGDSSLGVNASYSSSATTTMNTEEFGISRTTTLNSVSWLYKMQLDGLAESYSQPDDLFIHWWLSTTDVAVLPKIARLGTDFRAEAVWSGYRDPSCGECRIKIKGTFTLQMYRVRVTTFVPPGGGTANQQHVEPFSTSSELELSAITNW